MKTLKNEFCSDLSLEEKVAVSGGTIKFGLKEIIYTILHPFTLWA